ncbi:Hypothetical predicted protein, partial [Marmota monax]
MSVPLQRRHFYLFSQPAPKSIKGSLHAFSLARRPNHLSPSLFKTDSPSAGSGEPSDELRPSPQSPPRPWLTTSLEKSPAVTADARGGPRRAAPRRRRKLFPARKLPSSAAADRLPSPAAGARGRPFPGRGLGEPRD